MRVKDLEMLKASEPFDVAWYLDQYPDVKILGMDPKEHYLWIGKKLGRRPSPYDNGVFDGCVDGNSSVQTVVRDPYDYFSAPADGFPQDEKCRLTRLMYYIWKSRPDLQGAFDLEHTEGRAGFHHWFCASFEREYGIPLEMPNKVSGAGLNPVGANLIGYAKGELGMGEHVRMVASSLSEVGVPFDIVNIAADGHGDQDVSVNHWITQQQRFAVNIFHINADMMPMECLKFGRGHYNIGYWAWELPNCPAEFDTAIDLVDEIWCCSQFTADAFRSRAKVPVLSMPLAVKVPELSSAYTKEYYGLPGDKFTFFFTFDVRSLVDRKNPIDVVRAFNQAFPKGYEKVHLVFKVMNATQGGALWKAFLDEVSDSPRITLLNERFTKEDTLGLNIACDAFVSLHRSEGFGRCIAEAMSYGKPVISTNFSGSCEFVREETACAIDYDLIPVPEGSYPFSHGQRWARPDVDQAAWAMKKLFEDEVFRRKKAEAGQRYIQDNFNEAVIGQKYRQRLEKIRGEPFVIKGTRVEEAAAKSAARQYVEGKTTALFTITSRNYVSYARTVLQSVAELHPEYALFLCLADEIGDGFDPSDEAFMVVPSRWLGIPYFEDMTLRYDVLEFNTAVKPFVFQWLYENTDAEKVIYFDPDLYLYRRLDEMTAELDQGASTILTPHITEPLKNDCRLPNDHAMLQVGVFNLGFIATRRCEETQKFIQWWSEKLQTGADADLANSLFTDQKWCDLAPCFLPNLKILHSPAYNVAYWNLPHRQITQGEDGSFHVNGSPLVFFHFSGVNPTKTEAVSKHQDRFSWRDLSGPCQALFAAYGSALLNNDWEAALKYPYSYNWVDGLEIQPIMRRVYRCLNPEPRSFVNAQEARRYLLEVCNRSVNRLQDVEHPISELMMQIYRLRPDLREAFNLTMSEGRHEFRNWFASSGRREYQLTPLMEGI